MNTHAMTPRKLTAQPIYLEPEKAVALNELAASTRVPKAVLLREAVDDLLEKYRGAPPKKETRRKPGGRSGK